MQQHAQGDTVAFFSRNRFVARGAWSQETVIKLLTTSGLVLVPLALLTLLVKPEHYEVDIFAAAFWFWIFIFGAASAFIVSIIWQAHCKKYSSFTFSFLGLLLCAFCIFCLPVLRGYFLYGGSDPNSSFQFVNRILATGSFTTGDYYPVSHIIAAEMAQLTSLPAQTASSLVVPLLSVVFAVFIYCLAGTVFAKREQVLVAAVIGVLPLFTYYHVEFYPQAAALLLSPVAFYLLFRSRNDVRFSALLVAALVLVTFAHPIISLILVAAVVSVVLAERLCKARGLVKITHFSLTAGLIGVVVWFGWWTAQTAVSNFTKVIDWLTGQAATLPRTNEVQPVLSSGLWATVELALKMYGIDVLFFAIALVGVILSVFHFYRRQSESTNAFIIAVACVVCFVAYALTFASAGLTTVGRLFGANPGFLAVPLLAALPLSAVNKKKAGVVLISALIAASFVAGSVVVFRSAWILQPNWEYTYQDYAAYQWAIGNARCTTGYAEIAMPIGHIPTQGWLFVPNVFVPPHLGYDNNTTFRAALGKDTLILYAEQRQLSVSNNPVLSGSSVLGVWGLSNTTAGDLNKLQYDRTVNLIYDTGDTKALWVM